jgi:tRNA threonylcarbamoyladenosine biosynthesis protein TsaB
MTKCKFHNVLAIDTATRKLNLCLAYSGDRTVKSAETVEKSHGQIILKKIDELFQSSALPLQELEAIVVSLGPGSFTGLRIGLAVAKGLAEAAAVPVVGINLFELAAHKLCRQPSTCYVIIPSRRGEVYVGTCREGRIDMADVAVRAVADLVDGVGKDRVYGIGFNPADVFDGVVTDPGGGELAYDGADLIVLGREKLLAGERPDPAALEPMYLQKSIMETRFDQRRPQQ